MKRFAIVFCRLFDYDLKISFHPGDNWRDAVAHFAVQQDEYTCRWLGETLEEVNTLEEFGIELYNTDILFALEQLPE